MRHRGRRPCYIGIPGHRLRSPPRASPGTNSRVTNSENHFQRELQYPRVRRAADDAEAGAIDRCAGRAQIGVIQHVEKLTAELQPLALGYLEVLEQRVVQIRIAWRPQLPAARRADRARGVGGEYAGVEPARDLLLFGAIL